MLGQTRRGDGQISGRGRGALRHMHSISSENLADYLNAVSAEAEPRTQVGPPEPAQRAQGVSGEYTASSNLGYRTDLPVYNSADSSGLVTSNKVHMTHSLCLTDYSQLTISVFSCSRRVAQETMGRGLGRGLDQDRPGIMSLRASDGNQCLMLSPCSDRIRIDASNEKQDENRSARRTGPSVISPRDCRSLSPHAKSLALQPPLV